MPTRRTAIGAAALVAFIASIPLANWTLSEYGFVDVPFLGAVASGVVWIGMAFVARDVVQATIGKTTTLVGIVVGTLVSLYLGDPGLAVAGAAAFACSELLDFCVYTPLAKRRFLLAVLASSIAGSFLDSALFLQLAFDSTHGWVQLAIAKSLIVAVFAPIALVLRNAVSRNLS